MQLQRFYLIEITLKTISGSPRIVFVMWQHVLQCFHSSLFIIILKGTGNFKGACCRKTSPLPTVVSPVSCPNTSSAQMESNELLKRVAAGRKWLRQEKTPINMEQIVYTRELTNIERSYQVTQQLYTLRCMCVLHVNVHICMDTCADVFSLTEFFTKPPNMQTFPLLLLQNLKSYRAVEATSADISFI